MTEVRRARGDDAAGVISTAFGVGAFLIFLFFTAQIMVNLFFISTVTTAAHDAAQSVARGTTRDEAERGFVDFVGPAGQDARLDWGASRPDAVVLQVRVPYPELALNQVSLPFFDVLDRTVRVRVEELQE
ncbi:MAG: hypothetical protein ACRD0A_15715 [Acidimicrobiales bacterium]